MSVKISWYLKPHILLVRVEGIVDASDVRRGNSLVEAVLDDTDSLLTHVLIDATAMTRLTISVHDAMDDLTIIHNPKLGWLVAYGVPKYLKVVLRFFCRMIEQSSRAKTRQYATRDDALAHLRDVDGTLPELPSDAPG